MRQGDMDAEFDAMSAIQNLAQATRSVNSIRLSELTETTVDRITRDVNEILKPIVKELRTTDMSRRSKLRALISDVPLPGQIQQRMITKPRGYAGDYLTLDWLYQQPYEGVVTSDVWNRFIYRHQASRAVRSRIDIVRDLIIATIGNSNATVRMLDVASGPGRIERTVIDTLGIPSSPIHVDLVDADPDAIEYSRALLADDVPDGYSFAFHHRNAFRFEPQTQYDAIWSCGLFDYLDDRLAASLLRKLYGWLKPNGTLLIGNFSPECESQWLMEGLYDWTLIYRSMDECCQLAIDAGIPTEDISIEEDATGSVVLLKVRRR